MTDHELWNEIGNLYSLAGAYKPAIHAYSKASQMNSGWGRPLCNLAIMYAQTGNTQDAISLLNKGIDLLPDCTEKAMALNKLGFLYSQTRNFDQAIEAHRQANVLFSKMEVIESGQIITHPLHFPQLVFNHPAGPELENMALIDQISFTDGQDDTAAINAILEASEMNRQDFDDLDSSFNNWDTVNSTTDLINIIEGISTFTDSIINTSMPNESDAASDEDLNKQQTFTDEIPQTSKDQDIAAANQGTEPGQISNFTESDPLANISDTEMEYLTREIERCKLQIKNNPRSIYAWEKLSDFYKSAGQFDAATEAIQTAISINPNKPSFHYRLGLIHAVEHKEAEAVYEFKITLELDPNHSQAHVSLASQYFNMELNELGEHHLKKASETGFDEDSEYNRACLEAIRGNKNRALDLLQIALESRQTYVNWVMTDPDLDTLRGEKRFLELLTTYNLSA